MRSGPGTSYAVLTRIRRGEIYGISGRNDSTTLQLNVNGTLGWVSARYVSATNADRVPVVPPAGCTRYLAPACPTSQISAVVTQQNFERGIMLWRSDTREIYVLSDNGIFSNYSDNWNGEALTVETPPPGLLQPQMGFGYLWQNDSFVRTSLGWAVGPEQGYTTWIEAVSGASASSGATYLRLADGRAVALNYYADSWIIVVLAL
ncbi:MAG: hypothetical protein U0694_17795 [Anaerolineae bacterium]